VPERNHGHGGKKKRRAAIDESVTDGLGLVKNPQNSQRSRIEGMISGKSLSRGR
jgi:hypothetical protein